MQISVANGIEEFSAEEWSAVAGSTFYAGRPWHDFLEADPSYDVWYVAARDDGVLLGVLPIHLHAGGPGGGVDHFYDPRRLFGDGPSSAAPSLLLGGRAGYETALTLRSGLTPAQRRDVLGALVARAREIARVWGADGVAGLYLTSTATRELAVVFDGDPLLTDVSAAIPLHGLATVDDFLATLSAHRRRRVAREMRDFAGSELRVRSGRLSDWLEPAAALLAQLHRRYGHADTPELLRFHLAAQAEHLDDYSRVLVCERAGAPVAFVLIYEWERVWYARAAGVADGMRGASSVLFNVVYYQAIAQALQRGIARYELGPSSLQTKLLRGARPQPRWSLIELGDPRPRPAAAQRLREWDAELARAGHPPAAWRWWRELGLPAPGAESPDRDDARSAGVA